MVEDHDGSVTAARREVTAMSFAEWALTAVLVIGYLALLFLVGVRTFQHGYLVLGVLGVLLPLLWVIGALLPDKRAPQGGRRRRAA